MASIEFEVMPFADGEASGDWESERRRGRAPARPVRPAKSLPRPPRPPWPMKKKRPPRAPVFVASSAAAAASADEPPEEPGSAPAQGSEYVRWVQSALNRVEGTRLPVNGVMNPSARGALRRFQRRSGLPVDGIAGPDTEKALLDALGAASKELDFEIGDEAGYESTADSEVNRRSPVYIAWVQASLNRLLGLKLPTDGNQGKMTRAAIRRFQERNGLRADGVVGTLTEAALRRAGAEAPPGSATAVDAPGRAAPPGPAPAVSTRFITVRSGVQMTPQITTVVKALDAHFGRANLKVTLTSGWRPPQDQLRLIRDQAIKRGLDKRYPAITRATLDDVESWIGAWDDLLHRQKFVVNPPVPTCSRIVPGKCYSASPHSSGLAFDLSGADLDRIAAVLQAYCRQGGPLRQILVERTNNAVHVGIDSGGRGGDCRISER